MTPAGTINGSLASAGDRPESLSHLPVVTFGPPTSPMTRAVRGMTILHRLSVDLRDFSSLSLSSQLVPHGDIVVRDGYLLTVRLCAVGI